MFAEYVQTAVPIRGSWWLHHNGDPFYAGAMYIDTEPHPTRRDVQRIESILGILRDGEHMVAWRAELTQFAYDTLFIDMHTRFGDVTRTILSWQPEARRMHGSIYTLEGWEQVEAVQFDPEPVFTVGPNGDPWDWQPFLGGLLHPVLPYELGQA